MATIFDIASKVEKLNDRFNNTILETLKDSKPLIKSMIQDQLMAGIDENGKDLKPSYLDDPYFRENAKSEKQALWKARTYMEWKEKLYPPRSTLLLGLLARDVVTPNLIITGPYHQSITPTITSDSIKIQSVGFYAGDEIEKKYGKKILGLTKEARTHLVEYKLKPAIAKLLKEVGLK